MAITSLADHLGVLGWSASVAIPADLKQLMSVLQSEAWAAGAGPATAEVTTASMLPGFATLSLDPGLAVDLELSQPAGAGFRVDLVIAIPGGGAGPGVTLPGLTGGVPQSSGAGRSLQRWIQSTGAAVTASLNGVLRIEGTPGSAATFRVAPSAGQPDGVVQVNVDPPHVLFPGEAFGLHLPNGIILDDSVAAAPPPAGTPHVSDDPRWRGLSVRGAELFLPRGVPYVGGTVVPVELDIGAPAGIDARTEVHVPADAGRPHLRGVVEWHDPAALSLAACLPTLIDLSAEFDLDGTTTPAAGPVGGATLAAGRPLLLRARYARDARITPPLHQFDVTVQGEGRDGLLRVAVDDGVADNVGARVFVTGAALAGALAADTPASTAPSGDPSSAGLAALLGVASVLSSFCQQGKVVVHAVTVTGTLGPGSPTLILDVDYSVDILVKTITFGGLSIGMQDDVPMRVRYRQVRLEMDPAANGLEKFHISFSRATMDVEDPGRWRVPGAPFDVTGNRAGHGSTWFEIDLKFTLDLGPVKVSGATIRATFDGGPVPDVTLRGLDATLAIPNVIKGKGQLALVGTGFEAALAVTVEPITLAASAYLKLVDTPAGTMIVLDLGVDLPGAIPLGPTGLGLYSIGGAFGFNAMPDLPGPADDPVEYQLQWTPAKTHFSAGDLMFGLAAVVGTLPDMGFAFSAAGRILLAVPDLTFRAGLDATFLAGRKQLASPDQPVGSGAITGVLVYDNSGVLIGVRGHYEVKPLLEILLPVDAVFPKASPDWKIHVGSDGANGRTPGPVQVKILPDLLNLGAEAFLMVHGDGIPNVGGRLDFNLKGFSVAFGAGFHAVYGAGLIWLELAADAQFGIGTAPLVVRGHGHLEGALHLGPVSIGASADIDAQVGPGDTRWAKFSVCGEVDLFFFEISGCVDVTIGAEDKSVPPPDIWPMPELSMCDHAYCETGAVKPSDSSPPAEQLPVVWPDTIPLLKFPVVPGATGFTSAQFKDALLQGAVWKSSHSAISTSTGRTGADDLSYNFALTGLRLTKADGTEVPGPLDGAWQLPKVAGGAAAGAVAGELALLTWQTALWTSRLSDGGRSQPVDPLEPIAKNCTIRPRASAGWALGAPAAPVGDGWRMPPESGPGDALVSRFWVDVDVEYREQPVHPSLLGMPVQAGYLPGGPIAFPAPLDGGKRSFDGALAVPGLAAPGYWAHELGNIRTRLTVVDDQLGPELLVVIVDDEYAGQIFVSGGGTWSVATMLPGPAGATVVVFACAGSAPTTQVSLECPVGVRIALLGLSGRTKTAEDAAAAAAAASSAAANDKVNLLGKAKNTRRAMLDPGTTYAIEVTVHCRGQRTDKGQPVSQDDFGERMARFWFRTAPLPPPPPPPPKGYRVLGYAEVGAAEPGRLGKKQKAQDHFDVSYLQRYLLGYTPSDRVTNFFSDDRVGAHFAVDHVGALAAKYGHKVALVLQRTDLPPGSPAFPPTSIAAAWGTLSADAKGKQAAVDQRLLELDALAGGRCPVPHLGTTYGGSAGLVPGATYDMAIQVPKTGEDLGVALPGVVFTTFRFRNPREQVADLGFSTAYDGTTAGGVPVTEPPGLATLAATDEDSDAVLEVLLGQLGLTLWAPPSSGQGRSTLLWSRPDAGSWRLTGVLLESPEPLERPARMRLGALDCMGVAFDVVRRNATGTRVVYLTRTPMFPRRRRIGPFTWLAPYLSVQVIEHPAATSPVAPTTPPETSFVMRAVAPPSPAFAEELSCRP
jgi:hypothetical protein